MMYQSLLFCFVILFVTFPSVRCYEMFSMRDLGACSATHVHIRLKEDSRNSSGILILSHDATFIQEQHCLITLKPATHHGIVVSLRTLNILPAPIDGLKCPNYLEIKSEHNSGSGLLCGFSDDRLEMQSFTFWEEAQILYHSSRSVAVPQSAFQVTFTAVRKGHDWCQSKEILCRNKNCIWKGLTCDGHNNCGDGSDEMDKRISRCDQLSPGASIAVILVSVVGALAVLIAAASMRNKRITQQIERLYEAHPVIRTHGIPSTLSEVVDHRQRTAPSSTFRDASESENELISSRNAVNSSSTLLDPPPTYEETIQSHVCNGH